MPNAFSVRPTLWLVDGIDADNLSAPLLIKFLPPLIPLLKVLEKSLPTPGAAAVKAVSIVPVISASFVLWPALGDGMFGDTLSPIKSVNSDPPAAPTPAPVAIPGNPPGIPATAPPIPPSTSNVGSTNPGSLPGNSLGPIKPSSTPTFLTLVL